MSGDGAVLSRQALSLAGRTVLVTRPQGQAKRLVDALVAEGARAVEVPAIRIDPPESWDRLDAAIAHGGYDWVIFTSANGVRSFWDRVQAAGRSAEWFAGTRVAAIGPETARSIEGCGLGVDLMPDEYVAEALLACLGESGSLLGRRVLLPRADIARDALAVGLRRAGAIVETLVAYRTAPAAPPPELVEQLRSGEIDVVTLTSSSAVRALLNMLGPARDALNRTTIACIGPVTAATAREAGLRPEVVATTYTVLGLVAALRAHFTHGKTEEPERSDEWPG